MTHLFLYCMYGKNLITKSWLDFLVVRHILNFWVFSSMTLWVSKYCKNKYSMYIDIIIIKLYYQFHYLDIKMDSKINKRGGKLISQTGKLH